MKMNGKVAIVAGASRGIGAAVARAYSDAGANVVLAARHAAALDDLAGQLAGEVLVVPADVTDADSVANLVDQTLSRFGRLDVACNNAAHPDHRPTLLADIPVDRFDAALAVNLRGVFLAMKHEIPAMVESGGGAIVNMSSTAGHHGVAPIQTSAHRNLQIDPLREPCAGKRNDRIPMTLQLGLVGHVVLIMQPRGV